MSGYCMKKENTSTIDESPFHFKPNLRTVGEPKAEKRANILNKGEKGPATAPPPTPQPPLISATRLLPCARPDKVALIKMCYFSFQQKKKKKEKSH